MFVILMFIFVLQAIWLYIGDLAGKDLDTFVIVKLLLYITPTLIPLILPLTILLVSIMVFGQFAENYEFAAMKSTGISLQRAMRSLSVFIILLGLTTFIFSNNVIPWANYNVYNLRKNIAQVKPALAISKGQFNEIGSYNIKVQDKSGENGQYLTNVVIHKKAEVGSKNRTVIISESGELKSNENSNILQLVLYNGNYYEEIFSKKPTQAKKKPYAKSYFEEYTINVDLEGLNDVDINDKSYENRYNMLNVSELNYTIDSLYDNKVESRKNFSNTLYDRTSIAKLNVNISPKKDTVFNGEVIKLFDNRTRIKILKLALNTVNSTEQIISNNKKTFGSNTKWRNKHVQSLHDKYVLGLACIILFFVGAPLGALIRKGGIGLPLVIAILLFLTYHFIGIFAKNSSLDDSLNPVIGTWLSTVIMLPLSIFLTKRATNDRGLFEFDHITEPVKKLLKIKSKPKADVSSASQLNLDDSVIEDFNLESTTTEYQITDRTAFDIAHNDYKTNAKFTFIFYCIAVVVFVLFFVFRNNKLPAAASTSIELAGMTGLLFLVYFIMTLISYNKLYHYLEGKSSSKNPFWIFLGFVFYPLMHIIRRNKIAEDFSASEK